MSVSTIALLATGQFVTLQVFQNSGGALNVTGDGVTEFSMVRISAGTLPGSAVTGLYARAARDPVEPLAWR